MLPQKLGAQEAHFVLKATLRFTLSKNTTILRSTLPDQFNMLSVLLSITIALVAIVNKSASINRNESSFLQLVYKDKFQFNMSTGQDYGGYYLTCTSPIKFNHGAGMIIEID